MIALLIAALIAAPAPGEYGVVCFDPSTGAMNGTRVILTGKPDAEAVVLQHCTGSCSAHRTVSAAIAGDQVTFEIAIRRNDQDRAQFTGRVRGSTLELKGLTASFLFKSARLRQKQACPRDTVKADA